MGKKILQYFPGIVPIILSQTTRKTLTDPKCKTLYKRPSWHPETTNILRNTKNLRNSHKPGTQKQQPDNRESCMRASNRAGTHAEVNEFLTRQCWALQYLRWTQQCKMLQEEKLSKG